MLCRKQSHLQSSDQDHQRICRHEYSLCRKEGDQRERRWKEKKTKKGRARSEGEKRNTRRKGEKMKMRREGEKKRTRSEGEKRKTRREGEKRKTKREGDMKTRSEEEKRKARSEEEKKTRSEREKKRTRSEGEKKEGGRPGEGRRPHNSPIQVLLSTSCWEPEVVKERRHIRRETHDAGGPLAHTPFPFPFLPAPRLHPRPLLNLSHSLTHPSL